MDTNFSPKTPERADGIACCPWLSKVALFVATGFGAGYLPIAPGTWGSVVGVGLFLVLWKMQWLLPGIAAALSVSVVTSGIGERHFGRKDPSQVVVDEIVCFPLAMLGLPVTPAWLAGAFVFYRIFDVIKPPPANWSQRLPGGWGVTADDLFAALYTCAALHAIRFLAQRF
ncbi:MAG: phosphatidylglycerophosphatase A [Verrucomicrobiae bacterium]|nr:phosphatidylglycerophosphatase A [Verrucomicrobiae bacterium]